MASNFLPYIIPRTSATRHHYNLVTFAGIYLPPLATLGTEVISAPFEVHATLTSDTLCSDIEITSSPFSLSPTVTLTAEVIVTITITITTTPFSASASLTADVQLSDFTIESESFVVKPNITAQFTRTINSVPFEVQATLTIKGIYLLDISNEFSIFWNAANVII
jgi:hypothetical protein